MRLLASLDGADVPASFAFLFWLAIFCAGTEVVTKAQSASITGGGLVLAVPHLLGKLALSFAFAFRGSLAPCVAPSFAFALAFSFAFTLAFALLFAEHSLFAFSLLGFLHGLASLSALLLSKSSSATKFVDLSDTGVNNVSLEALLNNRWDTSSAASGVVGSSTSSVQSLVIKTESSPRAEVIGDSRLDS